MWCTQPNNQRFHYHEIIGRWGVWNHQQLDFLSIILFWLTTNKWKTKICIAGPFLGKPLVTKHVIQFMILSGHSISLFYPPDIDWPFIVHMFCGAQWYTRNGNKISAMILTDDINIRPGGLHFYCKQYIFDRRGASLNDSVVRLHRHNRQNINNIKKMYLMKYAYFFWPCHLIVRSGLTWLI